MPLVSALAIGQNKQKHSDEYSKRLCSAFIDTGIPLFKLENTTLKTFLHEFTGRTTPSSSYLRKVYLPNEFEIEMKRMREELSESYIWVSIDETTDVEGRHIVLVLAGKLGKDKCGLPFLVLVDEVHVPDHRAICQVDLNLII